MPATTPPKGRPTRGRADRRVAQRRAERRKSTKRIVWSVLAFVLLAAILVVGSNTGDTGTTGMQSNLLVPLALAGWRTRSLRLGHHQSAMVSPRR